MKYKKASGELAKEHEKFTAQLVKQVTDQYEAKDALSSGYDLEKKLKKSGSMEMFNEAFLTAGRAVEKVSGELKNATEHVLQSFDTLPLIQASNEKCLRLRWKARQRLTL